MAIINGYSSKNNYGFYIEITERKPANYIDTNITLVDVVVKIKANKTNFASGNWVKKLKVNGSYVIDVSGQNVDITGNGYYGTNILMEAYGVSIKHGNDGSKTIDVSSEFYKSGANYTQWDPGYCAASGSFVLTTIPRASDINASSEVNLGSSTKITIDRKSSGFKEVLKFKLFNRVIETIEHTANDGSYNWTPSLNTYAPLITEGDSATCSIECITYNGSSQVGSSKTDSIKLIVSSSVKPSASITLSEGDGKMLSLGWGLFLKGKSKLAVSISGSPIYGSPITKYITNLNDIPYVGSSFTTNTLLTEGSGNVSTVVTDKRGHSSDKILKSFYVVDYYRPSISEALVTRCNDDGSINDKGTRVKYTFKGNIAPVNNKNGKTFRVGYRQKGTSSYTYINSKNVYTLNDSNILISGTFSNNVSYDFIFEVSDSFETSSISRSVGTGFELLNFNASGNSLAIGKISEASASEKKLEVALDTNFEGSIKKDGKNILEIVYPVGSFYMSSNNTNPRNLFGFGTWEQLKGRFLYAASNSYEVSSTSGVSTSSAGGGNTGSTTLSINQIPSHNHTGTTSNAGAHEHMVYLATGNGDNQAYFHVNGLGNVDWGPQKWRGGDTSVNGDHNHTFTTNNSGGGQGHTHTVSSHSHTIPYISAFVWRRTK